MNDNIPGYILERIERKEKEYRKWLQTLKRAEHDDTDVEKLENYDEIKLRLSTQKESKE